METGSPEERAGFAELSISAYNVWLTAGHNRLEQSICKAPYLSAYHFAEWLAWNWWRLRWEPRKNSPEWELSHAMASIGSGYVWPNIRIVSDGENVTLVCKPTPERGSTPYRYINDAASVITAFEFASEVDLFIKTTLQRLQDCQVGDSNLRDVWQAVLEERQDSTLSQQRKLEALLGEDPGEMNETLLQHLLSNAEITGQAALEEIAANRIPEQGIPSITDLIDLSHAQGALTDPRDQITLSTCGPRNLEAAWKLGASAAHALREQEHIALDTPSTGLSRNSKPSPLGEGS